jgi:hypothetical protein
MKPEGTTTVTISRDTMRELKKRALARDQRYSEYLEELIRAAWNRNGNKTGDLRHGEDSGGSPRD